MSQSPRQTDDLEIVGERGYSIGRKIDKGSCGTVYLADYNDPNTGRLQKLACKIYDTNRAPDYIEVEILCKLNNPHVIQVHSILRRGPKMYIFMKFAENGNLLNFVENYGHMSEQNASEWFRQMTNGLQYLHSKEIAHRDLKCENILISENYNIKITDFGLSTYCIDQYGHRKLSQTYCGSTDYAAPEVLTNTPYNPKLADVWSAGVILYIMLNAAMPFEAGSVTQLVKKQIEKRWKFQPKVKKMLSENAKSLVNQLLEPDVAQRLTVDLILSHNWLTSVSIQSSTSTIPTLSGLDKGDQSDDP